MGKQTHLQQPTTRSGSGRCFDPSDLDPLPPSLTPKAKDSLLQQLRAQQDSQIFSPQHDSIYIIRGSYVLLDTESLPETVAFADKWLG